MMASSDETIEAVVGNVKDMDRNLPFMKEVDVGSSGKCLLIRHDNGEFTALGHKCTHYGAPLARGALSKDTIRCPWHGACFNARTGDIEDYPGLDSLQKYQVSVDKASGNVKVKANVKKLKDVSRNTSVGYQGVVGHNQTVIIIGGGPSSLVCAETLRKEGFGGNISVICKEIHPPYDRAKLSKALDGAAESFYLRNGDAYYKSIDIDVYNGKEALSVDCTEKVVRLSSSLSNVDNTTSVSYDKLFIATGGDPRTLHPLPGWNCKNVLVLRTLEDANTIATSCKEKKVVVVGCSFIGMEVASFLAKTKASTSISVICGRKSSVPFEASLGTAIGTCIMKMHEAKGVVFYGSKGVTSLRFSEDTMMVSHVVLSDGTAVEAEVVVLGIGVTPNTEFLKSSQLKLTDRGFVPVDCNMKTEIADVYAGGDVAYFPLAIADGQLTNIQHWQMAHVHGRIAALGIINSYSDVPKQNDSTDVNSIPFFWTVQFGISIRYAGYSSNFDDIIIKGVEKKGVVPNAKQAIDAKKFIAFYVKEGRVVAIATMMADPIAAKFAEKVKYDGLFGVADIDRFLSGG